MAKKHKQHVASSTEGMVIGGMSNTAPKIKNAPPIAVATTPLTRLKDLLKKLPPAPFSISKRLFTAVVVVAVFSIIGFAILHNQPAVAPVSTVKLNESDFFPKEYVKPQQAKQLYAEEGKIIALNDQSITISSAKGSQTAKLTSKTYFKKGVAFGAGVRSELTAGLKVQLTYDKENDEAYSVWYGY